MPKKHAFFLFLALVIWFSLVFFPIDGLLIEGRASLAGPMGILMLLLLLLLGGFVFKWRYTVLAAFPVLAAWGLLQFNAHWRTWITKASPERVEDYNTYFYGTWRIFPESASHTIPDLYHFVLGLLILVNLVFVVNGMVCLFKKKRKAA